MESDMEIQTVWKVQTSQLSRFHRLSHGFNVFLTVSR